MCRSSLCMPTPAFEQNRGEQRWPCFGLSTKKMYLWRPRIPPGCAFTPTCSDLYSTCVMFCFFLTKAGRLSLQTLHSNKTKPKLYSYIRLYVDEGSQSTKVLYRRQLDLFLFTSHPRGFQFHLRSSLHWSNNHRVWSGWNKSLIHHVVWNIRLYRSFPPRCFWCLLHIEHGGLRIYLQPNQRTAVRRQTQMVLERFIMFVWSLMNCFTTTRWKFSLLDLTSVSKTKSV